MFDAGGPTTTLIQQNVGLQDAAACYRSCLLADDHYLLPPPPSSSHA